VLDNILYVPASGILLPGTHHITVSTNGEGVLLDRIMLVPAPQSQDDRMPSQHVGAASLSIREHDGRHEF
jgi:hypothetical protein